MDSTSARDLGSPHVVPLVTLKVQDRSAPGRRLGRVKQVESAGVARWPKIQAMAVISLPSLLAQD